AACLALGLYADTFFLGTLVTHAIYVVVTQRRQLGVLTAYGIATLAAIAAFVPWLVALLAGARSGALTNNTFLAAAVPAKTFALKWIFNAGAVFFDLDYRWHAAAVVLVPILAFAAYAFVALVRGTPRRVWLLVMLSAAVTAAALVGPDLLTHQSRSTSARYLVPLWLALELAVGWYVARLVAAPGRGRVIGSSAALGLACAGVASCAVASGAPIWWGDSSVATLVPIAGIVAADPHALVAYRATWTIGGGPGERWDFSVVQLADVLPATVRFRQVRADAGAAAVVVSGTTFVLDPTDRLVRQLAARGEPLVPVAAGRDLAGGAVTALQVQSRQARAAAGIVDFEASLWRPSRST
ncbi:MAG: hypothetical protein IAI50_05870, partial [Candidatus Eremiobacteraeota bacterium]|nr:hypothetical protein [Candidatus Eremiobacteraeota bacterium]